MLEKFYLEQACDVDTAICKRCGALVSAYSVDVHDAFHQNIAIAPIISRVLANEREEYLIRQRRHS